MATRRTRVKVNQFAIQSMFVPGGQINTFGKAQISAGITRKVRTFAVQHSRTGELASSFRSSSTTRRLEVRFTVYSTAEHARFLEEGTRWQPGARVLYKGLTAPNPAAGRWQDWIGAVVHGVEGTRATHFMSNALNNTLREHRLV